MSPEAALAFLQLRPGASKSEIKQAYRRLAKQLDPDMFLDPRQKLQAEGESRRLQAAVDALSAGYSTPTESSAAPAHSGAPFGWFLLVATVLGATVWLIRYTIAAIRTHGSLTKALWQLNSWENRSALYRKWWDRF